MRNGSGGLIRWEAGWLILAEVVLALFILYFPVLQLVALVLFPLPVALLVRRYHLVLSVAGLAVVSLVLFGVSAGAAAFVSIILEPGLIGLVMGLLFKNHTAPGRSLLILAALSVMITSLVFAGMYWVKGTDPFNTGREYLTGAPEISQWYYDTELLNEEEQQQVKADLERIKDLFVILFPGSAAIYSVIITFISYVLAARMFRRLGYSTGVLPPFSTWYFPWQVIWGVIAGLLLFMAGEEWNLSWVKNTGTNILYVLSFLFAVTGLSVFVYFFKNWKAGNIFKTAVIIILIIYLPLGMGLILGLGLLDSLANLRRLEVKSR